MASRLNLHEELCELLGSRNVYFQPPASVRMQYPCIKYSLSGINSKRANNQIYNSVNKYEIVVIDRDPDSNIHNDILHHFPKCEFDRPYTADNLYHKILTLYY